MYLLSSDFRASASSSFRLDCTTLLFNCPYCRKFLFKLPSMITYVQSIRIPYKSNIFFTHNSCLRGHGDVVHQLWWNLHRHMHLEVVGRPQRIGETHVEKKPKWWVVSEGFKPLFTRVLYIQTVVGNGISEPSTVVSWVVEPSQLKHITVKLDHLPPIFRGFRRSVAIRSLPELLAKTQQVKWYGWPSMPTSYPKNQTNLCKKKHFLEHLFIGIRYHLNVACFYFKENNKSLNLMTSTAFFSLVHLEKPSNKNRASQTYNPMRLEEAVPKLLSHSWKR